jgi:hypothetical protein
VHQLQLTTTLEQTNQEALGLYLAKGFGSNKFRTVAGHDFTVENFDPFKLMQQLRLESFNASPLQAC